MLTKWSRFDRSLGLLFLLSLPLSNPWIRGDGVGYYAFARAPLIEHSFDFTHDYQRANPSFRGARIDEEGRPHPFFRTVTGHLDNHFTVGPAILWSPFLIAAHLGVLAAESLGSNVPADGFSAPYRIAMALGTAFYGWLALMIAFRIARRYVAERWAFLATIAVWWGTSLPVYMYFNPSWSHAHSAFVVSLFLWYWLRTRGARSSSEWLVLGLIAALMLNVYYANVTLLAVLLVEALEDYGGLLRPKDPAAKAPETLTFSRLLAGHALFFVALLFGLLPTFLTRQIVYGSPVATGYIPIRNWLWTSPALLGVLFSPNHGLLSWTPVVLFCLVGLVLFARREPVGIPFLAGAVAFYLFIACYPDWAGISSFGNRFFVSLTPLFIVGLAAGLETVALALAGFRAALPAMALLLGIFLMWNLGVMFQWGTHLIPARGPINFAEMSRNQFRAVPRDLASHLRAYFFRRKALMDQIEQRDIQQQKQAPEQGGSPPALPRKTVLP
jgi:hypothetical protein